MGHVLGHLGINVPDLVAAKRYFDEVMPALGFEPFLDTSDEFAYKPANGKPGTYLFVYPATEASTYSRHRSGLQHLAFIVPTRSDVRAVHALVRDLGCEVQHEPRHFPQYSETYYAMFWLDPFGFKFEAVCHHDRE
jgi:catechol 2,3-dioxygenase-like lactoylglutathione lyase family enzyme